MFAGPRSKARTRLEPLGDDRHVGDAAHVQARARGAGPAEQEPVDQGNEGRALAAGGDVARAEVGHDGQPGALGDDRGLGDLERGRAAVAALRPRMVPRGLAMRADQVDRKPVAPRLGHDLEGCLGELLAQLGSGPAGARPRGRP